MENLMAPFGFPWMDLFGSIFGGKMGGDNAPDVAAQKTPFGVKNGSTMPLAGRPLLCKKWPLIINKLYKNENSHKTALWTVKVKKTNKKRPTNRIDKPFSSLERLSSRLVFIYGANSFIPPHVDSPLYTPMGYPYS